MRASLVGLLLWLGCGWSAWATAQVMTSIAQDRTSLAFWRLQALGLESETAERLEVLLRAEAGRLKGFELQPIQQTEAILVGQPELVKCPGNTKCLCQIARTLGVDKLATGVIGALGEDYTFDLKLVDAKTCREERRINEALSGRTDLLIGAIRQALYKLVAPDLVVGSLLVEVPIAGARLELDDKPVGITPLDAPLVGLKPGSHKLSIIKEGFSTFSEQVQVRFAQTTRVKVDLVRSVLVGLSYEQERQDKPKSAPAAGVIYKKPKAMGGLEMAGWITGGVALACAAGAGVLGWRAQVAESELEQAASAGVPYLNASHQETYDDGETCALLANVAWGLAGAAALSSIVLFSLHLAGVGEENGTVQVSPTAGEGGAGAVLTLRF